MSDEQELRDDAKMDDWLRKGGKTREEKEKEEEEYESLKLEQEEDERE